ncbi:hypothetical protein V6N13_054737 [Hibiscus sabdariffa]
MQLLHGIDWSGPHKATSRWPACVDDNFTPTCLESYQWGKQRKLANHAFHGESLKNMTPAVMASVEAMLEKWKGQTRIPFINKFLKPADLLESEKLAQEIQDIASLNSKL